MIIGLDFGTSNCSVGIWRDGKPELLDIERGTKYLPSVFYTPRRDIKIEKIDDDKLAANVRDRLAEQKKESNLAKKQGRAYRELSENEIKAQETGVLLREARAEAERQRQEQSLASTFESEEEMETFFGSSAINAHLSDPTDGFFVKSPKTFLGADLRSEQLEAFREIVSRMLTFIKLQTEKTLNTTVQQVVIGRPVNFHGHRGVAGNKQAMEILTAAAYDAGFVEVEFLLEPVAAALDYERTLTKTETILVLDAGGGTTDCTMMILGPSFSSSADRTEQILASLGDRVGGNDLDIKINYHQIMPQFGKNSLLKMGSRPIPNHIFFDAAAVNDVNAQNRFYSDQTGRTIDRDYLRQSEDPILIQRLQHLWNTRATYLLNFHAEQIKIKLSDKIETSVAIDSISPPTSVEVTRDQLSDAITKEISAFIELMQQTIEQAGVKPDKIYITGGTGKSPLIRRAIYETYPDIPVIQGDSFGSITAGLTTWAQKRFSK